MTTIKNNSSQEIQIDLNKICKNEDDFSLKFIERELKNIEIELNRFEDSDKRRKINRDVYSISKPSTIKSLCTPQVLEGDIILANFRKALSLRKLSEVQGSFAEIFIQANLQNIYGDDFKANELRIKTDNNIDEIKTNAIISCPRRWGKTWITAWCIACATATMKNITSVVFSPAQRQSKLFMDRVRDGIDLLAHSGFSLNFAQGENNQEVLGIITGSYHNKVYALPSKEDTTRGISANIIICEEAAAMSYHFIGVVAVPLIQVKGTTFIAISTVQGEDNHFSKLLNLKTADGRSSIFNVFRFFNACGPCREEGTASTCKHTENDRPYWIETDRVQVARQILKGLDMHEQEEAEISGIVRSSHKTAFNSALVTKAFKHNKPITPEQLSEEPRIIYVMIDPTGGGASDLALISGIFDRGTFCLTGAESINGQHSSQCYPQLAEHIRRLRNIPRFNNTFIVIWVESNSLWLATDIISYLHGQNIPRLKFPGKDDIDTSQTLLLGSEKKQFGVFTTHEIKQNMYVLFREYLQHDRFRILSKFVSVHHPNPEDLSRSAAECTLLMIHDQLVHFYIQVIAPTNPATQAAKVVFSGKQQGGKGKDDLGNGAQLLLYHAETYIRKARDKNPDDVL